MNEPPLLDLESKSLYLLWRACYDAIRAISPDMAVGLADPASKVSHPNDARLPQETRDWLRNATHLFYAFHYYGGYPGTVESNVDDAISMSAGWSSGEGAAFMTETDSTPAREYCTNRGVGWTYYTYDYYCNVPVVLKNGSSNTSCALGAANSTCFGACIM